MTLMPITDKTWSIGDLIQWLALLVVVCLVLRLYLLSFDFIKLKLFKKELKRSEEKMQDFLVTETICK